MNSFENENDNHSIEIKDFFPKYTFGINLQYSMENFAEHKIYLQIGSAKMNVSIPDNNISKREISIKQFITPTNDFFED